MTDRENGGINDLPTADIEAMIAQEHERLTALRATEEELSAQAQPLQAQIEALRRELDPIDRVLYRTRQDANGSASTIRHLQEVVDERRARETRLRQTQRTIIALQDTALKLSNATDAGMTALGTVLSRVLYEDKFRLSLPDCIERDTSYAARNNGSRIAVSLGSDSIRVTLAADGQVAIGYHPKTDVDKSIIGDILSQVPVPDGTLIDRYFIGFRADLEEGVLKPFGLIRERTLSNTVISSPIDLPMTDDLLSLRNHVGDILSNGYISLRINGIKETLPPPQQI